MTQWLAWLGWRSNAASSRAVQVPTDPSIRGSRVFEPLEPRLLLSGDPVVLSLPLESPNAVVVEVETASGPNVDADSVDPAVAAVTLLPSTIKHMSGHHDGVDSHFTNEVLPHFNVISGTSGNASFLDQIRSQGKVYARHVTNPADSTSAAQLVSLWRVPFDSSVIYGGYDAIIIDEIHPEVNGSARAGYVAAAFEQLRMLYPDKIILAWTRWQLSDNPGRYSRILNAIRDYADVNVIEQYLREGNPNLGLIPSWVDRIKANIPGLLNKSIYGLYISQEGFAADDVANIGYLGFLDEQLHRIRNDPDASAMPGIGFWVYYRSYDLTTGYVAQLANHYYTKGSTDYLGNGNYNQFIDNPQFDLGTDGWTLSSGDGGSIERVAYSAAGVQAYHDSHQQASHGTHGLRTVRGGGSNTAMTTVNVTGGKTHAVSAYVLAGSGSASQAKIRVTRDNGNALAAGTVAQTDTPVGQGQWKRVQFAFDVPQDVSTVKVVLTDELVAAGTTLYWDFVELEDVYPVGTGVNEPPSQVGPLSVSQVAETTAQVTWEVATDPDGDWLTYNVQYRVVGSGPAGWLNHNGPTTTVQLTGLQPQASYDVRVQANDGEQAGLWRRVNNMFTTGSDTNLPGDANGDGVVDIQDLGIMGANFNLTGRLASEGDFNADGLVDIEDLGILGANWLSISTGQNTAITVLNEAASNHSGVTRVQGHELIVNIMADADSTGSADEDSELPGDANGDGVVDIEDLGILGANFNLFDRQRSEGDFNGDGLVDIEDLGILGANWLSTSSGQETASLVLNEVVLGRDDVDNTLKGMSVVVDSDRALAYITGIMTDAVSVVDLDRGTLDRTFYLTDHAQATKKLAFDAEHRRLWAIANKQDSTLWLSDPDTGEVIASRDISADLLADASNYPVKDVAVDPQRENFYVLLNDMTGGRVLIYDTSLHPVGTVLEGQSIGALQWDESRDALLAMTTPPPASGASTRIFVLGQGLESAMTSIDPDLGAASPKPPSQFAFEPAGDFYLAGQKKMWRIDASTGDQVWQSVLPYNASAIEWSQDELGILHQYGAADDDDIFVSRLSTFDADTGGMLSVRMARYEASRMDAVAGAGSFVVGNGGDASVSIFVSGAEAAANIKVGTAAEDILVTPDGQRMLVLNRLGGSQLVEYDLETGASRVLDTVAWPVRMIQRPEDETLFIFSHFEPKIEVRDLDTLEVIHEISLSTHGITTSYSDTLSDMNADPQGSLLVALQCEQGKVAIVDGANQSVLAVVELGKPRPGTGPGRMNAAVDTSDPDNRKVFVYLADDNRIYRLEESNDFVPQVDASAEVSVTQGIQNTYGFRSVYFSPSFDMVFAWNVPIDPDTLVAGTPVNGVERFVGENDGVLYAQHKASSGVNQIESLVMVDPASLQVVHEQVLAETMAMDSKVYLDFDRGQVAFTRSAYSEAHLVMIEDVPGTAELELVFIPDAGFRVEEATIPEVGIHPDSGTVYMYYKVGPDDYFATSNDGGLDFSINPRSPTSPGDHTADPRCVLMPDVDEDGLQVWRQYLWDRSLGYFKSMISHDGLQYEPEEGIRYDPPDTEIVGVHTAYTTDDGRVGLMYIGDKGTTTGNVRLAYSDDNGQSFQYYADDPLHDAGTHDDGLNQRDPTANVLDDGSIRISTMVQGGPQAPFPGVRSVTAIYSFTSMDNGLTFKADPGVRLEPEDFTGFDVWSLNDPSIIQLPDGRFRMYVAGLVSELPDVSDVDWVILSATTAGDPG